MSEQASGPPAPGASASGPNLGGLVRNLAVDVVFPWIAVQLLERVWNASGVIAFAVAALFPAASIVVSWMRYRRLDVIGLIVLPSLLAGIALAVFTGDVRFAVLKAAPGFGLFGLVCLASLAAKRPAMFYVGRYFTSGGDAAKAAAWTGRLTSPGFRRAMRLLTLVWGIACLAEAILGVATAFLLPPADALLVERLLGLGTAAALIAWTTAYARRRDAQRRAPPET